jgi:predicted nucleic acid-binding protein
MRADPAPQVATWARDRDRPELRTTSITLAEIRYGIARVPDGRRKQVLLAAVCRSRGVALATRNLPDFDGTGIEVMDPWVYEPR